MERNREFDPVREMITPRLAALESRVGTLETREMPWIPSLAADNIFTGLNKFDGDIPAIKLISGESLGNYTIGSTTGTLYQFMGGGFSTPGYPDAQGGVGIVYGANQISPIIWIYTGTDNAFQIRKKTFSARVADGDLLFQVASSGDGYLKGSWRVGDGSGAGKSYMNGAAGIVRDFIFETNGVARWIIRANGTAEGGSDTGSDFEIIGRDDGGNNLGTYFFINRRYGRAAFGATASNYRLSVIDNTDSYPILVVGKSSSNRFSLRDDVTAYGWFSAYYYDGSQNNKINIGDPGWPRLVIDPVNQRVGIMRDPTTYTFEVNGDIWNTGDIFSNKSMAAGAFYESAYSLNDDTAMSFVPTKSNGAILIAWRSGQTNFSGLIVYRIGGAPVTRLIVGEANLAVTTGALTGTTGTDGYLTISTHTDSKVYIENRRGGIAYFSLTFLGT